jgi:hypothetical protein
MLRNKLALPDSTLPSVAAKDEYRSKLLNELEKAGLEKYFPAAYSSQVDVARSILLQQTNQEKFHEIQMVGKREVQVKNRSGVVYFFKYRMKKEDDWKLGISGIQPLDSTKVSSDARLTAATDKKLKNDEPEMEQFEKYLKRSIFALRRSSQQFYNDGNYSYRRNGNQYGEEED